MRHFCLGVLLLLGCDSKDGDSADGSKAEAEAPALPTPQDVCAAYKTIELPDNVFVLSATTTTGSIKFNFDQSAALAEVTELRAESESPVGERQMHKGFVHSRRITLTNDGGSWKVSEDKETSRNEIFYVRRPVGDDPSKLFGAQIVERYGPKGGVYCVGQPPAGEG